MSVETVTREACAPIIVYVGNSTSADIHVLRLSGPECAIECLDVVPLPGMRKPGKSLPMTLNADRTRLYAVLRGEPLVVASYGIAAHTGRLTHLGNADLPASMAYVSVDRSGRFLLSASYGDSLVAVNAIDANGCVGAVTQIVATQPQSHAVLADANNRYVLATSVTGEVVHQFTFDARTGTLAANLPPAISLPAGTGPRHIAFHPDGKRLYVLGESDASVTVFDYDSDTGRLSLKQSNRAIADNLTGAPSAADLHVRPDGRFLYASERTSSTLSTFAIDPGTGTLQFIESLPTEACPRAFNLDPTGRWLFSVGQLSNHLTVYAIDADSGRLQEVARLQTGLGPDWVESIVLS
jgi:6-phosphogluconolactonase